jgi:hypothetical protein
MERKENEKEKRAEDFESPALLKLTARGG